MKRAVVLTIAALVLVVGGVTTAVVVTRDDGTGRSDGDPADAERSPRPPPKARPRKGDPVAVTFLQYNIQFADAGLDGVAADIRASGADVVLLNEVDDRTSTGGAFQAGYLGRKLGMDVAYDPNGEVSTGVRGNAVLTSFRIADVRRIDLPRPDGTEQRGLMRVRLTSPTLSFHVWTTHLNPDVGTRQQARRVQARIGVPSCTTVLGGDLNVRPYRDPPRLLREHLTDLWRTRGSGPGGTNRAGTRRIDYLYFAQARGRSIEVLPRSSSDHRALLGTIVLDPALSC